MSFLFGFELETVSPLNKRALSISLNQKGVRTVVSEDLQFEAQNSYIYDGSYSLVDDGSIRPTEPNFGVEFRSFITTVDDLSLHRPLFLALKELGVTTNRRCGLHIHVSHPTDLIDSDKLLEMTRHEAVRVGRTRKRYSVWEGWQKEHYRAVNQRKPNHVEFRWFNGAMDFRYVCQMIRLVNNYCRFCAGEAVLRKPSLSEPGQPTLFATVRGS